MSEHGINSPRTKTIIVLALAIVAAPILVHSVKNVHAQLVTCDFPDVGFTALKNPVTVQTVVGTTGSIDISVGLFGRCFDGTVTFTQSSSTPAGLICPNLPQTVPVSETTGSFTVSKIALCGARSVGDYTFTVTVNATTSQSPPACFPPNIPLPNDFCEQLQTSPTITFHVIKATPTITTTVVPSTITIGCNVLIGPGGRMTVCAGAKDSATLMGGFEPTGTITYTAYSDPSCTTSVFTSTAPLGSASDVFTPNTAGTYQWIARYSGDGNNNPVSTSCGDPGESLLVNKVTPVIRSTVTPASVTAGQSASDIATVSPPLPLVSPVPTGTVTYNTYSDMACTMLVFTSANIPLGTASASFAPGAGTYRWIASYNGDANNNEVSTTCGATGETLVVQKATPTLTTSIITSSTVIIGSSVIDQASLTGGFPSTGVAGFVTYTFFTSSDCTGTGTPEGSPVVGSGDSVAGSSSVLTSSIGTFSFNAMYSGDVNNNPVTSACEILTVQKATPTLTTSIIPSSMVTVGSSVIDQASLTGGFPSTGVAGFVTYTFFTSSDCTGTGTPEGSPSVGSGDSVAGSSSVATSSIGTFSFNAMYSGDINNKAVTSACEMLTVQKATPRLTTTINPSSTVAIGSSVSDQALLADGFPSTGVSGFVAYTFFTSSDCTGTGTPEGSPPVGSGDTVAGSSSVLTSSIGTFSFNAMYSGDINNNVVTSACEVLTVQKATPTISSTVMPSAIEPGQSATDLASITGGFNPTGSVTYTIFSASTCTGTPVFTSGPKPLGSSSDPFMPTSAGVYYWIATYSGDANNNTVSTTCKATSETLTVQDFTISACSSKITIKRGTTATCVITLTSVGGFSGTVCLSASITPMAPHHKTPLVTLKPACVVLSPGGAAISTLTIHAEHSPKGDLTYTITVTGTSGSLAHSVPITLTVTKK